MQPVLTPAEVGERMARGEPVAFIDVRSDDAWRRTDGKLPGAVRMPNGFAVRAVIVDLPRDRALVAYCHCPHEEDSQRAAALLHSLGFPSVYALKGGYDAWRDAGMPIEPKEPEIHGVDRTYLHRLVYRRAARAGGKFEGARSSSSAAAKRRS